MCQEKVLLCKHNSNNCNNICGNLHNKQNGTLFYNDKSDNVIESSELTSRQNILSTKWKIL